MCGIAGFWDYSEHNRADYPGLLDRMTQVLTHRGPDASGGWVDPSQPIGLGHRRLSIQDLSDAGAQPMVSENERYIVVFNGEIYNHLELRRHPEISAARDDEWRGHSDTETLLACLCAWGVSATLEKLVGMFAFAVWDRQTKSLSLARDRIGEKPLYYGWVAGRFVFASELKALKTVPGFANSLCLTSLQEYFRYLFIPAPRSIYQGVFKLEPGCLLTIEENCPASAPADPPRQGESYGAMKITRWWTLSDVIFGNGTTITDEKEAIDQIGHQLAQSAEMQLLSDVPVGSFLSGGVDSSLITSLLQHQSASAIKTFSIGFEEFGFNEAPYAKQTAEYLKTDHHEIMVSSDSALAVVEQLVDIYDEPFADSSQIPTVIVCREARSHMSVAISGDGGDELFGGYYRYVWGQKVHRAMLGLPRAIRASLQLIAGQMVDVRWNGVADVAGYVPGLKQVPLLDDKLQKLVRAAASGADLQALYVSLLSHGEPELVQTKGRQMTLSQLKMDACGAVKSEDLSPAEQMMAWDTLGFLPGDILCKVDRAGMAASLETRMPFLDHRLVELAWRIAPELKMKGGQGKWLLRALLSRYLPDELIDRPKAGFAVPIAKWLRGPLNDWAHSALDPVKIRQQGYLDPEKVQQVWQRTLSGRHNIGAGLWGALMFQAWLERNG